MAGKKLSIDDLFRLKIIPSIRLSPDAMHAVVAVRVPDVEEGKDATTLWIYRREDDSFEQATHGPADEQACWLDNRTFAFVGGRREKQKEDAENPYVRTRLYTMSVRGGEPRLRATLDGRVWDMDASTDGKRLAISYTPHPHADDTLRKRWAKTPPPVVATFMHWKLDGVGYLPDTCAAVHVVDLGGRKWSEPRRLTRAPLHWHSNVRWVDDGRILFLRRERNSRHAPVEMGIVNLRGRTRLLPAPVRMIDSATPSPEGAAVVFTGNDDPVRSDALPTCLYVRSTDPSDGAARMLAPSEGRMGEQSTLSDVVPAGTGAFRWLDAERVVGLHSVRGRTELLSVCVESGERQVVAGARGVVQCFDAARGTVLCAWGDYTHPAELYRLGRSRPVRQLNAAVARRFSIVPERWETPSERGVAVDTFLWATARQIGSRRRHSLPLIVYVHGGPALQAGEGAFHEYTWLAHEGYPVVTCNPRGSIGYGAEHGVAIHGAWGDRDTRDVLAVRATTLKRYPQFDPERTFIAGGSYGGFMANWLITRHPGVFRAAVSDRSISDYLSFAGTGDFPMYFLTECAGIGNMWEGPAHVWGTSPLAKLPAVTEPVLLIHSEQDQRCPIGQAEEMFAGLVELGKVINEDVRLVLFRGESHGLSRGGRMDNRRRRLEEILGWIRKHDRPRGGRSAAGGRGQRG